MRPFPRDLFGQVPVTLCNVRAWLLAVPRIDPDGPRAAHYVAAWNVPAKIEAAKLRGDFDVIVAAPQPQPPHWWRRFRWG